MITYFARCLHHENDYVIGYSTASIQERTKQYTGNQKLNPEQIYYVDGNYESLLKYLLELHKIKRYDSSEWYYCNEHKHIKKIWTRFKKEVQIFTNPTRNPE